MSDFPLSQQEIDAFIKTAFAEDVGEGDVTCQFVIPPKAQLRAVMDARHTIILAGLPLAEAIFRNLDPKSQIKCHVSDGQPAQAGDAVMTITGNARALLTAERTALNIVQHLSGIASLTHQYVQKISHTKAKLLDTRKTTAGLRALEKYAVKMGGGVNHRMGLYDAIMIKDNHIAVVGGVKNAIEAAKTSGRTDIQVECDTLEQVEQAVAYGANSLLLDNMSPEVLIKALMIVDGKIPCEASGGVTLETITSIAETGVNYISVGRLTQGASAVDIGLDFVSL